MTIGLLATGEELVNGDVLNTSSQIIARTCSEHHLLVKTHLIVGDEESDIVAGLKFLLLSHDVILVTGGLGPTSDDRTRFALAQVIGESLEFAEASWLRIVHRLQQLGLNIPENNRQQALFPKAAIIFPNQNGSADGCGVCFQGKWFYLLPGPPAECLPLLHQYVLPHVLKQFPSSAGELLRWRLFNVSEGEIASHLESVLQQDLAHEHIHLGYRIDYPYLEIKCPVKTLAQKQLFLEKIDALVSTYFLVDRYEKASDRLHGALKTSAVKFLILDHATAGMLERLLHHPSTHNSLRFQQSDDFKPDIICEIQGLNAHWQEETVANTELILKWKEGESLAEERFTLPYRSQRVLLYAAEWISAALLKRVKPKFGSQL